MYSIKRQLVRYSWKKWHQFCLCFLIFCATLPVAFATTEIQDISYNAASQELEIKGSLQVGHPTLFLEAHLLDSHGDRVEGLIDYLPQAEAFTAKFAPLLLSNNSALFLEVTTGEATWGPIPLDLKAIQAEFQDPALKEQAGLTQTPVEKSSEENQAWVILCIVIGIVCMIAFIHAKRPVLAFMFLIVGSAIIFIVWNTKKEILEPVVVDPETNLVSIVNEDGTVALYTAGEITVQFDPERINLQKESGIKAAETWGEKYDLVLEDTLNLVHIGYFTFEQEQEKLEKIKLQIQKDPVVKNADWNYQQEVDDLGEVPLYDPTSVDVGLPPPEDGGGPPGGQACPQGQRLQEGQCVDLDSVVIGPDGNPINDPQANPALGGNYAYRQWYLHEDPQVADAWKYISTYEKPLDEIIVAVIDTGIDYTHPDLQGVLWDGSNCKHYNGEFLGGCQYGYDFYDDDPDPMHDWALGTKDYHGTPVSGIIAMTHNNAQGGAGLAPNVKIMSLKVSGAANGNRMNGNAVQKAVAFAIHNGAHIINMSYGSLHDSCNNQYTPWNNIMHGVYGAFPGLMFASAGNDDTYLSSDGYVAFPGSFAHQTSCFDPLPNLISVGSSQRGDKKARHSNYGDVTIMAPGLYVYAPTPTDSPNKTQPYFPTSGTSIAGPFAAGVAGLIMGFNNTLPASVYKEVIINSGETISAFQNGVTTSGKRVDALNAVRSLPLLEQIDSTSLVEQLKLKFTVPIDVSGTPVIYWPQGNGAYVSGGGTDELIFDISEGDAPDTSEAFEMQVSGGNLIDSRGVQASLFSRDDDSVSQVACRASIYAENSRSYITSTIDGCYGGDVVTVEFGEGEVLWQCQDKFTPKVVDCRMDLPAITWCDYDTSLTEFEPIVSTHTGRVWMDRNLGALERGSTQEAYGCLFQWGRAADGHHIVGYDDSDFIYTKEIVKIGQSEDSNPDHSQVLWYNGDWKQSTETDLWSGVEAPNSVCPIGYRLPSAAEWQAENYASRKDLSLPSQGAIGNDFVNQEWFQAKKSGSVYWTGESKQWGSLSQNSQSNAALAISNSGRIQEQWGSSLAPVRCISDESLMIITDPVLQNAISQSLGKPWNQVTQTDLLQVTTLTVVDETIQDYTGFDQLINLESLTLQNAGIIEIPSPVARVLSLKKLTTLDLSRNNIAGVISPEIINLYQLRNLNLAQNQFTGDVPNFQSNSFESVVLCVAGAETNQFEQLRFYTKSKFPEDTDLSCIQTVEDLTISETLESEPDLCVKSPSKYSFSDLVSQYGYGYVAFNAPVYVNYTAFAMVMNDGSVVTWGDQTAGGDSSEVADQLTSGVKEIYATGFAFAALKEDGSLVVWGHPGGGGDSSEVADQLTSGVKEVFSTASTFVVLKEDGSVVTWGRFSGPGRPNLAGDYGSLGFADVADQLTSGVKHIYASSTYGSGAFAALKEDGSVVTWGNFDRGARSSDVAEHLTSGVKHIVSAYNGFAALKEDGSVVSWGPASYQNSPIAQQRLNEKLNSGGFVDLSASSGLFYATKEDGSSVMWGRNTQYFGAPSIRTLKKAVHAHYGSAAWVEDDQTSTGYFSVHAYKWSGHYPGLNSTSLLARADIRDVFSSHDSFAAIEEDGTATIWTVSDGSVSSQSEIQLNSPDIKQHVANSEGFAFLEADGSVKTLTTRPLEGPMNDYAQAKLNTDVKKIISTSRHFAALKEDGSVIVWGSPLAWGEEQGIAAMEALTSGVVDIYANTFAFTAVKEDGSIYVWGDPRDTSDENIPNINLSCDQLTNNQPTTQRACVESVNGGYSVSNVWNINSEQNDFSRYPNGSAFAALKGNGSVVTWGDPERGGDSSGVASELSSGVQQIVSNGVAFAAIKDDDSVITWGMPDLGGDSSGVASELSSGIEKIFSTERAFAALKNDGSVVTWGQSTWGGDSSGVASELASDVQHIAATIGAFAALKNDGSVVTWGAYSLGGLSDSQDLSSGVQSIFASENTFAALKNDGSVVTWGSPTLFKDGNSVASELSSGVETIFTNQRTFTLLALKADGSIVSWGGPLHGGGADTSNIKQELSSGVKQIVLNNGASAALKEDGSVVTWGHVTWGGDSSGLASELSSGVEEIFANNWSFAALKEDGSVLSWGSPTADRGGDSSSVAQELSSGVEEIFANYWAYAALKEDGSVVTWGTAGYGGDSSSVAQELSSGVEEIFTTAGAFTALKEDGSIVSWGSIGSGADSSGVDFSCDIPDNTPPVITPDQTFNIGQGITELVVEATDVEGDTLLWQIVSGNEENLFDLSVSTGVISVRDLTALSTDQDYILHMRVSDGTDQSAIEPIVINLIDEGRVQAPNIGSILSPEIGDYFTSVEDNPNNIIEFEIQFDDPYYQGGVMNTADLDFRDVQVEILQVQTNIDTDGFEDAVPSAPQYYMAPITLTKTGDNTATFTLPDMLTSLVLGEGRYTIKLTINVLEDGDYLPYEFEMNTDAFIHIDNTAPNIIHQFPDGTSLTSNPVRVEIQCDDSAGLENIGCDTVTHSVEVLGNYCSDGSRCNVSGVRTIELCDALDHCASQEIIVDWYEIGITDTIAPSFIHQTILGLSTQGIRMTRDGIDGALPAITNAIPGHEGNQSLAANETIEFSLYVKDLVPDAASTPPHICSEWVDWEINNSLCKLAP